MMAREDDVWLDEAAGPLVRPYAMTRGGPVRQAPNWTWSRRS